MNSNFFNPFAWQREWLRTWQNTADEVWRGWLAAPPVLAFNGFLLDRWLDWYQGAQAFYLASGGTAQGFRAATEAFSAWSPYSTRAALAWLQAGQRGGWVPPVAATPHEVVYQQGHARLLHYRASRPAQYTAPVFIVSSLVGRHYILDLTPGRSYVAFLLEQGFDVYLADWGAPDEADAQLTLADYVDGFLPPMLAAALQHAGAGRVHLLGYSFGGLLALLYTALYGAEVADLLLLATPIDFHHAGLLTDWTDERYFDVDRFVDLYGNLPADMVAGAFQMVKPASSLTRGLNQWSYLNEPENWNALLALEVWLHDAVPFPGEVYRTAIKKFYRENALLAGTMAVGGRAVDLSRVTCPVLQVAGDNDQIAPPESAAPLKELARSQDLQLLALPYGHLTISVGDGAREDFWARSVAWFVNRES